ncbi:MULTISPECIES: hypothetical protein, partial [unclassified Aliiroseovarius]|uniref:hypothetical protein n=1 Tax=unclassified Aliiroseovarius TaxID=2623558 RepID=UPI001C2C7B3F
KSTVYIPKPSRNPKGQKWTTFTPPATTLCRRYRGRVLLRRSHDVIFPLAQKKIEIDLDDGVKANYPKFGSALKKIAGLS